MKILPILLIGAGGFFLYRSLATPTPNASAGTPKPDTAIIPKPEAPNTKTLMLAKAGADPKGQDDWNWWYRSIFGKEPPDVLLWSTPEQRSDPVSIDTWYAGASRFGLTGIPERFAARVALARARRQRQRRSA